MSVNELLANPDQAEKQRQAEKDFIWPAVSIGEPGVVWYPHADRNQKPVPCQVCDVQNGVVTIVYCPPNNMPITKTGVRHVDDPFHKAHQDVKARTGGWDFYCDALRDTKVGLRRAELTKAAKLKAERAKAEAEAAEEAVRKQEAEEAAEQARREAAENAANAQAGKGKKQTATA